MPKASLIISFYNKIDYLKLVLAGLERQSFRNFEIIIADDGSAQNVVEEIEKLSREISFPLTHIWHEDKGFRKNKILNKAIEASNSGYLIFIDGDCIPHPEFINQHFIHKQENVCLTGRRVNLSEELTRNLSQKKIKSGYLDNLFLLFRDSIFGGTKDAEKGIFISSNFIQKILNKKKRGILGCNFSLFKQDIKTINGFDERYEAPSIGEDSDIQFRLELTGVEINSLNNSAVQYHLYHKLQERLEKNFILFEEVKKSNQAFTPFGIIK